MTNQGQFVSYPIRGAQFRPPASGLLSVLGSGSALLVRREPDNPYDPNALQVLVRCEELEKLPEEQLQAAVEGFGFSSAEVLGEELIDRGRVRAERPVTEWHLGYIPRVEALQLASHFDASGVKEIPASFIFDLSGRPAVAFVVP